MTIEVDISDQSVEHLKRLAVLGIYGRNPGEIAARLIDKGLIEIERSQGISPEFLIQTRARAFNA